MGAESNLTTGDKSTRSSCCAPSSHFQSLPAVSRWARAHVLQSARCSINNTVQRPVTYRHFCKSWCFLQMMSLSPSRCRSLFIWIRCAAAGRHPKHAEQGGAPLRTRMEKSLKGSQVTKQTKPLTIMWQPKEHNTEDSCCSQTVEGRPTGLRYVCCSLKGKNLFTSLKPV